MWEGTERLDCDSCLRLEHHWTSPATRCESTQMWKHIYHIFSITQTCTHTHTHTHTRTHAHAHTHTHAHAVLQVTPSAVARTALWTCARPDGRSRSFWFPGFDTWERRLLRSAQIFTRPSFEDLWRAGFSPREFVLSFLTSWVPCAGGQLCAASGGKVFTPVCCRFNVFFFAPK